VDTYCCVLKICSCSLRKWLSEHSESLQLETSDLPQLPRTRSLRCRCFFYSEPTCPRVSCTEDFERIPSGDKPSGCPGRERSGRSRRVRHRAHPSPGSGAPSRSCSPRAAPGEFSSVFPDSRHACGHPAAARSSSCTNHTGFSYFWGFFCFFSLFYLISSHAVAVENAHFFIFLAAHVVQALVGFNVPDLKKERKR